MKCIICVWILTLAMTATLDADTALQIDSERKEVRVSAIAHPDRFQGVLTRLTGMPGYHLLVWRKGHAARNALFTTSVPDSALHGALVQLGGKSGNALAMDVWEKRHDRNHPAPDQRIKGSPIDILAQWNQKSERLENLLLDPGGKGFDFRFGRHLANIPAWHSGYGVCLYSCPGSKIGNAAYTVRDYVNDTTAFRIRDGVLPGHGSHVWLIFTLRGSPVD